MIYPWHNKIINISITNKKIISVQETLLKEVSLEETQSFLKDFHLYGECEEQIIRYGLYFNDELLQIMTFGKSRYRKGIQWELLRVCTNPVYDVINGYKKLLEYFILTYSPKSIIAYCDTNSDLEEIYKSLEMVKITNSKPKLHFWREKDRKHFTFSKILKSNLNELLNIKYDTTINKTEILCKEGFVQIKDCGQSAYVYLKPAEYLGYVYLVTDTYTNLKYVGQHIGNTFNPNYFGSGRIIKNIIKKRKEYLKIELLEWCKQDISEREIYYINKYNTLWPNGYNLTIRPQSEVRATSETASERMKKFAISEEGKAFYKENSKRIKQFYMTEQGKQISTKNANLRKEFAKTDNGKKFYRDIADKHIAFCSTQKGKAMREARRIKQIEYNQTEEGKLKEKKRIQKLKDFYATEIGKAEKEKQLKKRKNNPKLKFTYEKMAINYSKWAKTEEGKKKLKEGAEKAKQTRLKNNIAFVNSLSDKEWQDFLIAHPRTTLAKYRK